MGGKSDHTGIVEKAEQGIVYIVRGNAGDCLRINHYSVEYYDILEFGIQ